MHKAWKQRYDKIYRTLLPSTTTPTVPTEAAQSAASNVKPVDIIKPPKVIDGSNEEAVVSKLSLTLPTPDKDNKKYY